MPGKSRKRTAEELGAGRETPRETGDAEAKSSAWCAESAIAPSVPYQRASARSRGPRRKAERAERRQTGANQHAKSKAAPKSGA